METLPRRGCLSERHLRLQYLEYNALHYTTTQQLTTCKAPRSTMAEIKAIKDQIWYIKRDIQNEEKKRDEWATTVSQ